jgi:hypothetical protein
MPPDDITMNAIRSPGNLGAGVDSAFPEQPVMISTVSTILKMHHLGMESRATITQIGIR